MEMRDAELKIRLTPSELAEIRRRAATQGMSVSEYIRQAALRMEDASTRVARTVGRALTAETVAELRRRHRAGARLKALAREYDAPYTSVVAAIRGRTWRSVDAVEPPVPSVRGEQIAELRRRHRAGESIISLALEAGLGYTPVRAAIQGRSWRSADAIEPPVASPRVKRPRQPTRFRAPLLTDQQVIEMRQRHRAGESVAALAREYGVSHGVATFAIRGRTHRGVDAMEPPVPWSAQLKAEHVIDMRRRRRAGESVTSLAIEYGVSYGTVWLAVTGQTWSSVNPIEPPVPGPRRTPCQE